MFFFLHKHPKQLWGPHNFLRNRHSGCFQRTKQPECGADHPIQSSSHEKNEYSHTSLSLYLDDIIHGELYRNFLNTFNVLRPYFKSSFNIILPPKALSFQVTLSLRFLDHNFAYIFQLFYACCISSLLHCII
jgi:hypothetical protein